MKGIKSNKCLFFASIGSLMYFLGGDFLNTHEFVKGFCVGISIVLYLVGLYSINHDINKLKDGKRNLLKKIVR